MISGTAAAFVKLRTTPAAAQSRFMCHAATSDSCNSRGRLSKGSPLRMIFRKGEPFDKRPRELQESLVAAWHMNLRWAGAGVVLGLTNAVAVPRSSPGRGLLL